MKLRIEKNEIWKLKNTRWEFEKWRNGNMEMETETKAETEKEAGYETGTEKRRKGRRKKRRRRKCCFV